jgi:hypothetical protein
MVRGRMARKLGFAFAVVSFGVIAWLATHHERRQRLPEYEPLGPQDTIDLGFDLTRRDIHSSESNCDITLVFYKGVLAHVQQRCSEQGDVAAPVSHPQGKAARARLDDELGTLVAVSGTPAELAAYETLAGPGALVFGSGCGIAGTQTEGAAARDVLVRDQRDDLLRNALRGMNPAGRAFAMQGLEARGKLDQTDNAVVNKLAGLPIQIETCGGCLYGHSTSNAIFSSSRRPFKGLPDPIETSKGEEIGS